MEKATNITPRTGNSTGWAGLIGCLGTGVFVILLIISGTLYLKGRFSKTEADVTRDFIEPYLLALRAGDASAVWQNLTTEAYRQRHPQEMHATHFRLAIERLGPPESVTITKVVAMHEAGRSFLRVKTRWKCPKLPEFFRTFELIHVPGQGYRLDKATFDGRAPSEISFDAW